MKALVLDLETTIRNEDIGRFKADPEYPDNFIVAAGGMTLADSEPMVSYHRTPPEDPPIIPPDEEHDVLIVGQNVAFDIYYLARRYPEWREWMRYGTIWDTMIIQYLLTGQREQYASLDVLALEAAGASAAEIMYFKSLPKLRATAIATGNTDTFMKEKEAFYAKWSHVLKDDKIKEYWNSNIDTTDIPKEELIDYLKGDVVNTKNVFEYQLQQALDLDIMSLIWVQMEARMATIEMELNGTYVNQTSLAAGLTDQRVELAKLDKKVREQMATIGEHDHKIVTALNPASSQQLSAVLFGGTIGIDGFEVVKVGGTPAKYKTGAKKGQVKYKKVQTQYSWPPLVDGAVYSEKIKSGKAYKTGDDVLDKIISESSVKDAVDLCANIQRLRALNKDISTYYEGYGKLVWPHDSCIHPSYQHCSTGTGRLSCSNPNLQQVSGKGDI